MLDTVKPVIEALKVQKNEEKEAPSFSGFAKEISIAIDDLSLSVSDVGEVSFPFTSDVIHQLISHSQLAKFGFKEATLEDPTIRCTHEISGKQLSVHLNERAKEELLKEMQLAFGLPSHAQLTLHVHNLLIYGPGHFFKWHQDSEKVPGMLGTFVIILPSPHIGGDLLIRHRDEEYRFVSSHLSLQRLRCVGFYADSQHTVEEVKEGYRVALTFHLALRSSAHQQWRTGLERWKNPVLTSALSNYFNREVGSGGRPPVLTYLLDHEYSKHGLSWGALKGRDSQDALSFLEAAHELGLKAHLALVNIHEQWTTEEENEWGRYDERYNSPRKRSGNFLGEIIDKDVKLTYWIDSEDRPLPYKPYYPCEDGVCWIKPTEDFKPTETKYEGWMGNYGNTADYWYQRAALVLWRSEDQIAMKFQLCYQLALDELLALTKAPGQASQVIAIIEKAGVDLFPTYQVWGGGVIPSSRVWESAVISFMRIAEYINEPERAYTLLEKVPLAVGIAQGLPQLVSLQGRYGIDWCLALLEKWIAETKDFYAWGNELLLDIDLWAFEARGLGVDEQLIVALLQCQYNFLLKKDKCIIEKSEAEQMDVEGARLERLEKLVKGCFAVLSAAPMVESLIIHIKQHKQLYDTVVMAPLYFSLYAVAPHVYKTLLEELGGYLRSNIDLELAEGLRSPDDWSIKKSLPCSCEHCQSVEVFLNSHTERQGVWSVVQDHRYHIRDSLSQFKLPIELTTLKKGRPYKLLIEKTEKLYEQAKERYEILSEAAQAFDGVSSQEPVEQ